MIFFNYWRSYLLSTTDNINFSKMFCKFIYEARFESRSLQVVNKALRLAGRDYRKRTFAFVVASPSPEPEQSSSSSNLHPIISVDNIHLHSWM